MLVARPAPAPAPAAAPAPEPARESEVSPQDFVEVIGALFNDLGLPRGHKQLEAGPGQLEAKQLEAEEEVTIEARSFLHYGILVNPQYATRHLNRSTLSKIMAAVEDLPSECEKQIRFLRLLGVDTTVIALTPDVGFLMVLLRATNPKRLVGTLDDYLWMGRALSIVVASPDDERFARSGFVSSFVGGIILPQASKLFLESKVLPLLSTLYIFGEPGHYPFRASKNWLAEVYRDIPSKDVRTLLERHLPEALSCPGLGDCLFKIGVTGFAYSRSCRLVNDWSGILAFLPGIMCASVKASGTSCLVVAPLSRVAQLVKLIAGYMEYMGIRGVPVGCVNHGAAQEKLRIAVGTPDKVAPSKTEQLVLVETDVLLSLGFEQQLEKLLCIPDVQVGLHADTRSVAVDHLVARLLPGKTFCPKAGGSLNHVDFYCVETEKKVARLYEIWRVLGRLRHKMQIAVYCNTPESVKKVGRELDDLGVPVCLRHSEMCIGTLKKVEAEFDTNRCELLVTDIFVPSSAMDVVLCDLPRTPGEFVGRVCKDRNNRARAKVVISIVSSDEERQLLADVAEQYQVKFQGLPEKLPQVYLRSVRPCPQACSQMSKTRAV